MSDYTLTENDAKALVARFYMHKQLDPDESTRQGRKVERNIEMVELRVKGDKNQSFSRPKHTRDETMFPNAWAVYKREGDVGAIVGISLTALPGITPDMLLQLNDLGVQTIEDMAELLDTHASKIKMGLVLKKRAQSYLERLKTLSDPDALDALTAANARIAELESGSKQKRGTNTGSPV